MGMEQEVEELERCNVWDGLGLGVVVPGLVMEVEVEKPVLSNTCVT